jgi:hypothetical protein
MKFAAQSLLLVSLAATFSQAQTQSLPHFQHIVIVFQENRTPDNLFGAGPMTGACGRTPFEPGVDIADSGPNKVTGGVTCLSPLHLSVSGVDPDHRYNPAWINEYDGGKMDGACENTFLNPNGEALPQCPQYTYVFQSDVQPYFDLATSYGFANYMFESSEGPSFPAHQFILAGTSAPVPPGNTGFNYFDAENPNFNDSGCPFPQSQPFWVDPLGNETTKSADCYEHNTLIDVLRGKVTWRYYTPTPGVIWDAPAAISSICGAIVNHICTGPDFANVIWPGKGGTTPNPIPFFQDVKNCNLQQMSWVIPDYAMSDHPTFGSLGPNYVANLVDLIGDSTCKDPNGQTYWQDTAIFITWDDWGGFYDHVNPPFVYRGETVNGQPVCKNPQDAPNGWGCGYVYGFRVPMLVVSAYTPPGYISGICQNGSCQNKKFPFQHDSGSILAFIENNFKLGFVDQSGDKGYADYNALDWSPDHATHVPLSDFFPGPFRGFTSILPTNSQYDTNYFLNYYTITGTQPQGPDGDAMD